MTSACLVMAQNSGNSGIDTRRIGDSARTRAAAACHATGSAYAAGSAKIDPSSSTDVVVTATPPQADRESSRRYRAAHGAERGTRGDGRADHRHGTTDPGGAADGRDAHCHARRRGGDDRVHTG